ncbi:MAG: hypothetical protein ACI3W5_09255 [Faecousia sp.]
MVRRGILVALAVLFLVGGGAAFYWYGEGAAALSAQSTPKITEETALQFPFAVPGTDLVALELTSYAGQYLEDGSVETVADIAAIILRNDGADMLEDAQVELWQGDRKLCFHLSYLPAGEKIMVLESNRGQYQPSEITACRGSATVAQKDIPGLVTIRETQGKILLVTNPGPIPLTKLTIYFKTYDPDKAMFIGGIAYEIQIYRIAPGETYFTEPGYYVSGLSRIVKIETSGA